MARDCATKRYSRIQPWYSIEEIKSALHNAAPKLNSHLMRSQTLADIPHGSVARRATNLEDYVVGTKRQTRQSGKGDGATFSK